MIVESCARKEKPISGKRSRMQNWSLDSQLPRLETRTEE